LSGRAGWPAGDPRRGWPRDGPQSADELCVRRARFRSTLCREPRRPAPVRDRCRSPWSVAPRGPTGMIVLVTGAAGRIGYHGSRLLRDRGDTVRGLVLPGDPNTARLAATGTEIVHGRLEDRAAINRAVQGVDAVIHLGAALTSRGGTDDEFFEVN